MRRLREELAARIHRHADAHDDYATPVSGLRVARVVSPMPPTMHIANAWLCMCVRGQRKVVVGDETLLHGEESFLISALELPTVVTIADASPQRPYMAIRIDLDLAIARQLMAEVDLTGRTPPTSASSLTLGTVDLAFLDSVTRLVRLIESPADIPFMGGLIHREILYRLLTSSSGGRLRQIARLGSTGHSIAKAVSWLRTHFRERLSIEQLADVAGMGVSTLHRHFHALTTMSPIQYQKQLRLHEARRLILENEADVASAAFDVGYESSTQFIREYRRWFGQPPLRDITAIRAAGGVSVAL